MTGFARSLTLTLIVLLGGAACAARDSNDGGGGAPPSTVPDTARAAPPTTRPQTTAPPIARQTLAPAVQVAHASDDPEWDTDVHVDEADRTMLVERFAAAVAAYDAATDAGHALGEPLDTDPGAIESIDLDEHLIVTTGYYCQSGDPRLDAGPGQLVVEIDDDLLCDAPQPISSIFVVPRPLVGESFTLTVRSALDLVDGPTIVVEQGVVTTADG